MRIRAVPFDNVTTEPLPEKCHVTRHFAIPKYMNDDTVDQLGTTLGVVIQLCERHGYNPKDYMIVVRFD